MTSIQKNIWKLANVHRHYINFEFYDGNEWRYNKSKGFYKWLLKLKIPKSTEIYLIENLNNIEEMKWENIIVDWEKYFFANFGFEIWEKNFSWLLVHSKIGVTKYGTKG